jgi:hypothetical protein
MLISIKIDLTAITICGEPRCLVPAGFAALPISV